MLVAFAGERPSLDNAQAKGPLNAARNLAVVKIPFDLSDQRVLSTGLNETGGFYGFGGGWDAQENRCVPVE
jgi:hypothetical protein